MIESKSIPHFGGENRESAAMNPVPIVSVFRYSDKQVAIRIFLACWMVFSLHFATNTVREIYPALSLGDRLSFDVSEYAGLHHDIFEFPGRGSFINNNPGASMMGALPYALFRPITDRVVERVQKTRSADPSPGDTRYDSIYPLAQEFYERSRSRGFDIKFGLAAGITQAFVMAPISALGVVVMFWFFSSLTKSTKLSIFLALLYAIATPILFRTAQLNQNVLLANFALFAFALLWRPWAEGSDGKPHYFLAGLCCGWTVVLDYSGVVAVAALSGYAFSVWLSGSKNSRNPFDLVKFASGIAICAVVLMAYQWISFGDPILPAQSYMPPANFTDQGYRGFSFPQLDLLFETAFGMRYGLFTSAPILLLAFAVPVWVRKQTRLLGRRELIFVVSFAAMFFLFCSANQYGRMQFNTGVRHIVPIVPFIFLLAANVLIKMPKTVAVPIGVLATYWSWCLAMYRDVEQGSGIFEAVKHITLEGVRLPWLTTLERMGFVGSGYALPLLLAVGLVLCLLWTIGPYQRNHQSVVLK
jgi:hypothetical protein